MTKCLRCILTIGCFLGVFDSAQSQGRMTNRVAKNEFWFLPQIQFDTAQLPENITITTTDGSRGWPHEISIRFSNAAKEEFSILDSAPPDWELMNRLPDRALPVVKLDKESFYEWGGTSWKAHINSRLSTDSVLSTYGLRPFDIEFKDEQLLKSKSGLTEAKIKRKVSFPIFCDGSVSNVDGEATWIVDYSKKSILSGKLVLEKQSCLRVEESAFPYLLNTSNKDLYFLKILNTPIDRCKACPKGSLPLFKISLNKSAYPLTALNLNTKNRVENGWAVYAGGEASLSFDDFLRLSGLDLTMGKGAGRPSSAKIPKDQNFRCERSLGTDDCFVSVNSKILHSGESPDQTTEHSEKLHLTIKQGDVVRASIEGIAG